ncbi:MAG: helix-turn-helix domain-containing protein [Proteobacteria bacterium]|nr:helix-turn-helix domain-containing protein [Pseudomonadota bacterium]
MTALDATTKAPADIIDLGPALSLRGTRMHFERNEEIFGEGEPAEYLYRVVSGAVRVMRFSTDGRRQILSFHLPGEVFGIELADKHSLTAEALDSTEVVMVRRSLLEKAAAEDARAARCWLEHASHTLDNARDHALILGRKGAGERVAAFLLGISKRLGQELDLPMSRADIADYLGLTIETVSRAFTEMERQHAIGLPSSRHVVMRNRSTLAMAAA